MDDNDLRKTMQGTNNQKLALNGETEPNAQALNDMFGFIEIIPAVILKQL